jgi:hypothetical protein
VEGKGCREKREREKRVGVVRAAGNCHEGSGEESWRNHNTRTKTKCIATELVKVVHKI